MKSAQQAVEKWASRAAVAAGDYVKGAEETSKDQAAAAAAAAGNYKTAVIEAANAGRFEAGVRKAGKQKWLEGVRNKGGARFSEGVSAATSDYVENSARFDNARNAAASLPRGPKGSPGNLERVRVVANALRAAKVGKAA